MKGQKKITLRELYLLERAKPNPAQMFIRKICRVTGRKYMTVRAWIYGVSSPSVSERKVIAEALDVDPEGLFEE